MSTLPASDRGASVLTAGFGATVAMWAVGYLGRLPGIELSGPLVLALLLACLLAGGVALGRYTGLGSRHGAAAGLVSGLLNLLVLGSFLGAGVGVGAVPSALLWVPGSILVAALLAAAGAEIGARWIPRVPAYRQWTAAFAWVAVAAALLLVGAGGLVTSTGAGLAVVDWPNTFGYNMFLYPFSRMTGGIYYEHAHRLFGALVGVTTLVLAVLLAVREPRAWVRRLAWAAAAMVLAEGILGGLRVTGRFTLSSAPEAMRPSVTLAMIHGVVAQLVFSTLVALSAFTSAGWSSGAAAHRPAARRQALLPAVLVVALGIQLVVGAAQRHLGRLLLVHILLGVAVVAPLALHVGLRSWGLNPDVALLRRLGLALAGAAILQVALGFTAFVAPVVTVRTAHQAFGAVVLGLAVLELCWTLRLGGNRVY